MDSVGWSRLLDADTYVVMPSCWLFAALYVLDYCFQREFIQFPLFDRSVAELTAR